jgi:hypothetical protein
VAAAAVFAASLLAFAVGPTPARAAANAIVPDASFGSASFQNLGATDDGSSGFVPFGFSMNYYGTEYSGAYVNNNGNLTFTGAMSTYTPFGLGSTGTPIVAPFFADVDTNQGNTVEYGTGTLDGHDAFVATWPGVECYLSGDNSNLDYFQVILVDRPDLGTGAKGDDFEIEFNYNSIQWDAGQASGGNAECQSQDEGDSAAVGYSNGTPADSFELTGSQVNGAFLDSNSTTGLINNDYNSSVLGRYIWTVANGTPITPTTLATSLSGGGSSGGSISVDPDTSVHDTATLSGTNAATAGGTVTYGVYSDSSCADLTDSAGTVTVTDGAVPASSNVSLTSLGTDYWEASYSGDSTNAASSSGCSEVETVMVLPATTTAVAVHDATTDSAWNGTEVTGASAYATSTVTGVAGYPPTGTVTYDLYSGGACSGTPEDTQTVTLSGGTVPHSSATGPLSAGSYSYRAAYSGDSTYDASASTCVSFSVAKAAASAGAVIDDATLGSAWNGDEVTGATAYDTGTVTGVAGFTPTGTMTYHFYTGASCGGTAWMTSGVTLSGGTVPDSATSTALDAGTYSTRASYSGDSNYSAASSSCASFVVQETASGVGTVVDDATLGTAWSGSETIGASAYDTATVTTVGGIAPTGTLTYNLYLNGTCAGSPAAVDTVTLSGGHVPSSSTQSDLGAGTYSFQGAYGGDSNYQAGAGACEPFTVAKSAATLGAVVDDASTSAPWSGSETVGAAAYATATVTGVSGFAPSGSVTYSWFGNATCSGSPAATDTVTLASGSVPDSGSTGSLGAGPQGLEASYAGDGNYQPGSVACATFTVLEAPVITSADATSFTILEAGTFTVTAIGYPSGASISLSDGDAVLPSGVTFVDNGDGTATLAGTPPAGSTGSYPFTVAATNGVAPAGSQSFTLTVGVAGTATALSSGTDPSVVGQAVSLTARVSVTGGGSGSPTGTVSFEDGGSPISGCASQSLSAGAAGCTASLTTAATHTLTAVYSGDANFATSTATPVSQTVDAAATITVVTVSANPAVTGESVTYVALVSRTVPATGTVPGTVAFSDAGNPIGGCGAAALSDGLATCTVGYAESGGHTIVAAYGGDANDLASTSAPLAVPVDQDATVTTVTSTPNPSTSGALVTVTVTVKAVAPGTGNPTGTVTIYVDGAAVATIPLDSSLDSQGVYATSSLTVGTHAVTATYAGDSGYLGSSASATADAQVVGPPLTVPETGGGAGGWAGVAGGALALLLGGLTLVVGSRRRSRVPHATT